MANAGAPLALARAISEARAGNAARTAVFLAEAFGWLPPPPPSAEEIAVRQQAQRDLAEANRRRLAGVKPLPAALQHAASVSVDSQGNPLREPYRPHPRDPYAAPMSVGPPPGIPLREGSYDG